MNSKAHTSIRPLVKAVLPTAVQRFLYVRFWNPIRRALWKRLELEWTLRSGLVVSVGNHADWTIYNEIFVSLEYDEAIAEALRRRTDAQFRVLDLGANVGFFALRAAEAYLEEGGCGQALILTCVEGSRRTYEELNARLYQNIKLLPNFKTVLGLVGRKKQGQAYFSDEFTHYGNSISNKKGNTTVSEYIDLDQYVSSDDVIDLLKCDIEGAEFEFVNVYERLLKRTRILVIEIHRYGKDPAGIRSCLRQYGFVSEGILREETLFIVEMFANASLQPENMGFQP